MFAPVSPLLKPGKVPLVLPPKPDAAGLGPDASVAVAALLLALLMGAAVTGVCGLLVTAGAVAIEGGGAGDSAGVGVGVGAATVGGGVCAGCKGRSRAAMDGLVTWLGAVAVGSNFSSAIRGVADGAACWSGAACSTGLGWAWGAAGVELMGGAADGAVVTAVVAVVAALGNPRVAVGRAICAVVASGVLRSSGTAGSASIASDRPKRCEPGLLMANGLALVAAISCVGGLRGSVVF